MQVTANGLPDLGFELTLVFVREHAQALEVRREGRDRIAALPHGELLVRPVERLVVLGVAVPPVGLALDERGAFSAPGARERAARRLIDGQHVVAVDGDAVEAVALRAIGDVVDRHALLERHRIRVLVVLADKHDR